MYDKDIRFIKWFFLFQFIKKCLVSEDEKVPVRICSCISIGSGSHQPHFMSSTGDSLNEVAEVVG